MLSVSSSLTVSPLQVQLQFRVDMEVVAARSMEETQRQQTWACSATETLLILLGRNLACLLLAAESLLIGLIAEDQRLSVKKGYKKGRPDEENKDGSDSDDNDDDDDEDADADDDDDEDDANDENFSGDEGEEEADPEDDPAPNGGAGSDDDDDDDGDDESDSDDDDDDEDEEDEDDEEEEDDEDVRQPPAKKRK
ncbi:uncharacterized protein LOC108856950 isoform X1 [Raphanus sativus]|uniref:Uncharacterized protein LOC108856950 isoform X1 n=2 Tax=Raphanus sativus TaxID=3726 RepID=A0A6J0NNV2_RAPSA|nr:uncharacterized protein LOC108856950 isoform X1 [Raphanus sativus]